MRILLSRLSLLSVAAALAASLPARAQENAAPPAGGAPGSGVWTSYDFVPGDRVIFFDDFSGDAVNDPPRRLVTTDGDGAVGEGSGRHWFTTRPGVAFDVKLPAALPDRFTLELAYRIGPEAGGAPVTVDFEGGQLRCGNDFVELEAGAALGRHLDAGPDGVVTCRLLVNRGMAKVYLDSLRMGAAGGVAIGQTNSLHVNLPGGGDTQPTVLAFIRIAEAAPPLYETLSATGRVATHGLLFDSGSDVLRGASTPTLGEIVALMAAHPELRLTIEGHTDATGDAAANQALSQRRAEAVRAYLVAHGVSAARLTATGAGSTHPVAPNDTPQGREQNRRVELVRG